MAVENEVPVLMLCMLPVRSVTIGDRVLQSCQRSLVIDFNVPLTGRIWQQNTEFVL